MVSKHDRVKKEKLFLDKIEQTYKNEFDKAEQEKPDNTGVGVAYKYIQKSMDAGTDGGRLRASGQFMSGYKPLIETNTVSADTSASDWAKGLFDCTTSTVGGDAAVVKSFSLTIENPASRVGYQSSSGETDGYVRQGNFNITGSITVKSDSLQQTNDDTFWKENTTDDKDCAIALGDGSLIDFSITKANISNISYDMADEGIFQTFDFVATSGEDGGSDLATIKLS